MRAFKITDIKDFMNKLLAKDVFDTFCMTECSITTFNTFFIDGKLNYDFYDTDECRLLQEKSFTYSSWKDIRPYCYSVIRGKRAPLSFKVILALTDKQMKAFLGKNPPSAPLQQLQGLYINIQYRHNSLLVTSGVSHGIFSADKSVESSWDATVGSFLKNHSILFEEI